MNGFDTVELNKPGLLGRLMGRKPKINAIREIQNILATRPLADVAAADVEHILSDYLLPRDDAHEGLKELYKSGVKARAQHLHLTDDDIADLRRLHYILGLDDKSAKESELEVLREHYRNGLKHALLDGALSDSEKTSLIRASTSFGLPADIQAAIYKDEVHAVVQQAFNDAIKDRRLTPNEEQRLAQIRANLDVTWTHDDNTEDLIDRFKLLARIENGDLPVLTPPIRVQRGEQCHAEFPSTLRELRKVTKRINYRGPSGSIRIIKGLSYRYGSRSVTRVTSEELTTIDSGVLYISNKRLLFNGTNKNVSLQLKRILHFTLYADGIRIEKDSGRDQVLYGRRRPRGDRRDPGSCAQRREVTPIVTSATRKLVADVGPYQLFMLMLCLWALITLSAGTFLRLEPATQTILDYADTAVCVLFFVDFIYTFVRAPHKRRYLLYMGMDRLAIEYSYGRITTLGAPRPRNADFAGPTRGQVHSRVGAFPYGTSS